MSDYVIVTDSSCDLPKEKAEQMNIAVVDLDVTVDGEPSCPNSEVNIKEFYKKLRDGKMAKTSAVNIELIRDCFKKILDEGKDILYLGFSSGLSTTFNTGRIVAEELSDEYPDRKVYCVDTLAASLGQGLLVYLTVCEKEKGKSIEEVRDYAEETKLHLCHWFTVDDLHFLKRGGRISGTVALVGSVLGIKPILHTSDEGLLVNVSKARGRKASIEALVKKLQETGINPSDQVIFISHGDCEEDAIFLKNLIEEKYHPKAIMYSYVGPVIGAHSGPGTLALFYLGTQR